MPDAIERHRLRREIVATQLANAIINRGGSTVVVRLADQTGADAPTIASAYAAVRDSYDLISLNGAIDKLDGLVPGAVQLRLYRSSQDLMLSRIVWFIRHIDWSRETLESVVTRYRTGIQEVAASISATLEPVFLEALGRRAAALMGEGVPEDLAVRIATLPAHQHRARHRDGGGGDRPAGSRDRGHAFRGRLAVQARRDRRGFARRAGGRLL